MTRRIRDDFVGVVHAPGGVVLKAGDEVPEGVEVGDHLLPAKEAPKESAVQKPTGKK